jgi:uncharacterized protein YutE (UPF0331/DUF86 family)
MSEQHRAEDAILERYEPNWIAQGYKVVRPRSVGDLPAFLKDYVPDALLLGRTPQVVVEVTSKGSPHAQKKIAKLKSLLQGHADWRLEVLFVGEEPEQLPLVSAKAVQHSLESIRAILSAEPKSALLLFWATLEAIARRLEPAKSMRPQSPGRVVELLAGAGHVTPGEAGQLRRAVQWRNRLIHGDLDLAVTSGQVAEVVEIAESLNKELFTSN